MGNKFMLIDKINNVQKEATAIIKFNFENKDYLIYSIDDNGENSQIFSSRLILNSEGVYFLDNILPEEKNKLNTLIYSIVISLPTESKKGLDASTLLNDFSNKYVVTLSSEIPNVNQQEYFQNCSFAITNRALVLDAINFYEANLKKEATVEQPAAATWSIPVENGPAAPVQVENPAVNNNVTPAPVSTPEAVLPNMVQPEQQPVFTSNAMPESIPTPVTTVSMPGVPTLNENVNMQPNVAPTAVAEPAPAVAPEMPTNFTNEPVNNVVNGPVVSEPAPTVAVVSDQNLVNATNINQTPAAPAPAANNAPEIQNAGFAINKFIIIGTVCLILAVIVVVVAYFLIKQKTTGV